MPTLNTTTATAGTLCPDFVVVPQHVASNPVARAIQRARINAAVRDFTTRLHLLQPGEQVATDVMATSHVLHIALHVLEQRGQLDDAAARVIRGGISCLVQLSNARFLWQATMAIPIDTALDRARQVVTAATPRELQAAYRHLGTLQ